MDITEHVKEFRALQKTQKIRVADFCRERMLDYYEMVEALKKDKFLSELPEEHVAVAELEVTDLPLEHPDPKSFFLHPGGIHSDAFRTKSKNLWHYCQRPHHSSK